MKGQRSEIACDAVGATAENDADDEDEDYYVEGVVDPNQPLVVKAVFEYLADVFYVPVKDGRPNVGDKPPPSPGAHLDTVYGTTEGLGLKASSRAAFCPPDPLTPPRPRSSCRRPACSARRASPSPPCGAATLSGSRSCTWPS